MLCASVQQRSQGLDRLDWMQPPAQFKRVEARNTFFKNRPFGLVYRIGLGLREFRQQHRFRKRSQKWTCAGAFWRKKYDRTDLQRRSCEPIASASQIELEFLDAAAAADYRRAPNGRRILALYPAQRVCGNVQEVCDTGCKQRIRCDEDS